MIGPFKRHLARCLRSVARLRGVFVSIGALAIVAMFLWTGSGVVFNYSHSAPFGLYREQFNSEEAIHDPAPYVFFCPDRRWPSMRVEPNYRDPMRTCPDGFSPLIKPVVAWPGDLVSVSAAGISVNGRRLPNSAPIERDSKDRQLRPFPAGEYRVGPNDLWVVSSFSPRSFDSRYFGPIPLKSVHSWLRPLLVERTYHSTPTGGQRR
ncbi:MAG: conjugative transfer signal peptidase TraF [Terracidiphilus sp.]